MHDLLLKSARQLLLAPLVIFLVQLRCRFVQLKEVRPSLVFRQLARLQEVELTG